MKKPTLKICYVLSYKSPDYIRSKTLLAALSLLENIEIYRSINSATGITRYIETLFKLIKLRLTTKIDVFILGFRGHEIFPLVRLLTLGKPLIFDAMVSPYDAMRGEKKWGTLGLWLSYVVYWLEYFILHSSDVILTDTNQHKIMYENLFKLPSKKVHFVFVSTDEKTWLHSKRLPSATKQVSEENIFSVFYYATFVPLHGIEYVLHTAKLLAPQPIKFLIVGGSGKALKRFYELKESLNLSNVVHFAWLDFERLAEFAYNADLCLGGPFGNTPQSMRVITGKTFQFLAMGKPVVVGENLEASLENGFINRKNCLIIKQGNSEMLAKEIEWAFTNREELKKISESANKLYIKKFSNICIAHQIEKILMDLKYTAPISK